MVDNELPKNRVLWLSDRTNDRDAQILRLEKDGYVLKQISACGDRYKACCAWFVRKKTPKKTNEHQ